MYLKLSHIFTNVSDLVPKLSPLSCSDLSEYTLYICMSLFVVLLMYKAFCVFRIFKALESLRI